MDKKDILFKRKLRYVFGLLIIFIAAFVAFGFFVYQSSEAALFNVLDDQYEEAAQMIRANPDSSIDNFISGRNIVYTSTGTHAINYKIFLLVRDEQSRLLNAEPLRYFEYLNDIKFSPADNDRLINQQIFRRGAFLYYRTYTIAVNDANGQRYYIQMATEVSNIVSSLNVIWESLLRGMVVVLLISAAASWILGNLLIKFVSDAWKKQDMFIALASHELRSPLTVIHNSLELLLQTPGKRVIDNSKLILNALTETNRMRKVATNLLNMARLESDNNEMTPVLCDLEAIAREIAGPFEFQAEASGKLMQVDIQPGLQIYGQKQDLDELLVLLLENAIKYTEKGDMIGLSVSGDEHRVTIRVEDTGIGIDDASLKEIFNRFYRGERARGMAEGSGLGLNIVSNIVTQHDGTIKATHNTPKGTVFTVCLPRTAPKR